MHCDSAPCHTVRNLTWTAHCRIISLTESMQMPMPWARVKDQRKTKLLFSFTFRRHFFQSQRKLWGWSSLSNYGHLSLTLFTFHPMPTAQLPVEKNTQVQVHVARGKNKMLGFQAFLLLASSIYKSFWGLAVPRNWNMLLYSSISNKSSSSCGETIDRRFIATELYSRPRAQRMEAAARKRRDFQAKV